MHLRLAATLGLLGLCRPILSIGGAYDSDPLAKPVGPLLLTAALSVVWVAAAVLRNVPNPILTLALAGIAYALFALALNLSLQPVLDDAELIPPAGYVSIPLLNAVQGAVLGLIAAAIQRARRRTHTR